MTDQKDDGNQIFPVEQSPITAINILLNQTPSCSSIARLTMRDCSQFSRRVSLWTRRTVRTSP